MTLGDSTAKTLSWLALILLVLGLLVGTAAATFFLCLLSAIPAGVALAFAPSAKRRIFPGIVLAVALLFAFLTYGDYRRDMGRYRSRVGASGAADTGSVPTPAPSR